jgi:hypothetical protein
MNVAFFFLGKGRKFRVCCTPFRIIRPSRGCSMRSARLCEKMW